MGVPSGPPPGSNQPPGPANPISRGSPGGPPGGPPPSVLAEQQRRAAELARSKKSRPADRRGPTATPNPAVDQQDLTASYAAYTDPPRARPEGDRSGERAGVVRDLQNRSEPRGSGQGSVTQQIYTFRLERYDAAGNRLPPIPVEMRGDTLWGVVNEGDWVEIPDSWQPNQTLRARKLTNLTTGSTCGAGKTRRVARRIILILFLICVVGIAVIEYLEYRSSKANGSPFDPWFGLTVTYIGTVVIFAVLMTVEQALFKRKIRAGRR
jgi:hypothetical protein